MAGVVVDVVVVVVMGTGSSPLDTTLMTTTVTITEAATSRNIASPIFTNLPHRIAIEHTGTSSSPVPPPFPPRPSSVPAGYGGWVVIGIGTAVANGTVGAPEADTTLLVGRGS
jgi:hypothetical protein